MNDTALPAQILNSLVDPVLVADTEHTVVYMNSAAVDHYTGGDSLIEVLAALRAGKEERLISDSEKRRIYMRAVRDEAGEIVGYYERYEPKIP